ncbi:MAG: glycogen/starch synthase [Bacteroidales bacterium]|nr:glycogen/starch synthase [Bacteroidales bacterium]
MEKVKVLYIAQEIIPYLPESHMGTICRYLPQGTQERGREIRTFMPRFGNINERRNQLHEVIRLSGMNLIIDDNDHPLIIKVASIQQARMQVYFIDNEDYFQRKATITDKSGNFFDDNDERAIFFSRGVLETVKKLGWPPDIVHCHGWLTSLVPIYIKKAFRDNPLFSDTKVIYSVYNDEFKASFNGEFAKKIKLEGITNKDLNHYQNADYESMMKAAIDFSDAVIVGDDEINSSVDGYLKKADKPTMKHPSDDNYIEVYNKFYDEVLGNK